MGLSVTCSLYLNELRCLLVENQQEGGLCSGDHDFGEGRLERRPDRDRADPPPDAAPFTIAQILGEGTVGEQQMLLSQ